MRRVWSILVAVIVIATVAGTTLYLVDRNEDYGEKKDYWEYEGVGTGDRNFGSLGGIFNQFSGSAAMDSSMNMAAPESSLGFAVGGAKDANNFRENIENGYFPISTDITYNGLFYDYSFDTGIAKDTEHLFAPAYSTAISKDPVSEKNEYYMTVGLMSNIKESDFDRKKLNLTVVLDISGSMSSSFNEYYYDDPFGLGKEEDEDAGKSKMEIANKSVNILLDQLNFDDRFGMILFDNDAYIGQKITSIADTDIEKLKNHILEVEANGGTNFSAGYTKATELYDEYKNIDSNEYENRIIVITDAMPNYGSTNKNDLMSMVKDNADNGIYTTFIGVGVDFNTALVEEISNSKGANYYSVHSSEEFKTRMGEEFEYMVTPMVFDLKLDVESEGFEIEKIYGSDTANEETGNIMNVNTLFPSKTNSDGEVKGGVVLLKLKKINEESSNDVVLTVSYKDRNGEEFSNNQRITFEDGEERYDNTGIRKAITLTRYVNVLKNWILYERAEEDKFLVVPAIGIVDADYPIEDIVIMLGEHERPSVKLTVSDEYKTIFEDMKMYINEQNSIMNDETFDKEIKILDLLINTK